MTLPNESDFELTQDELAHVRELVLHREGEALSITLRPRACSVCRAIAEKLGLVEWADPETGVRVTDRLRGR